MSEYGLTKEGFKLKPLDIIVSENKANAQTALPGIDTGPDSVSGVQLMITSNAQADAWLLMQAVYSSQYPNTAEGVPLDNVGEINAIPRKGTSKSIVYMSCKGTDGTLIAAGTQVQGDNDATWESESSAALDNAATSKIIVQVTAVVDSFAYQILINGNTAQFNSGIGTTIQLITQGLVDDINGQTVFLGVNATVEDLDNGIFSIISNNGIDAFNATLGANLSLNDFWTPIKFNSVLTGPIEGPALTITHIVTSVFGLDEVINFSDAELGSDVQEDQPYRFRLFTETRRVGGGNLEAIKDRILNEVDDVSLVKAFENDKDEVDIDGRPPKSIEILVEGGSAIDIANELWLAKGGGIETFGTESEIVTDSQGDLHVVKFSRPISTYIWFKINLTVSSEFPVNGVDTIKNGIVLTGRSNFSVGDEIIIQQFFTPIYAVEGVDTAEIEIGKSLSAVTPPAVFTNANLPLGPTDAPLFDFQRVDVVV